MEDVDTSRDHVQRRDFARHVAYAHAHKNLVRARCGAPLLEHSTDLASDKIDGFGDERAPSKSKKATNDKGKTKSVATSSPAGFAVSNVVDNRASTDAKAHADVDSSISGLTNKLVCDLSDTTAFRTRLSNCNVYSSNHWGRFMLLYFVFIAIALAIAIALYVALDNSWPAAAFLILANIINGGLVWFGWHKYKHPKPHDVDMQIELDGVMEGRADAQLVFTACNHIRGSVRVVCEYPLTLSKLPCLQFDILADVVVLRQDRDGDACCQRCCNTISLPILLLDGALRLSRIGCRFRLTRFGGAC